MLVPAMSMIIGAIILVIVFMTPGNQVPAALIGGALLGWPIGALIGERRWRS